MDYVALPNPKKNSLSTTIAAPGISDSDSTIPVAECSVFYDDTGTLITEGIVIAFDNATESASEEIKITGCSAASGAGNLTGATRGVSADGTNGAAAVWPEGTKIAVMFTSTLMKRIADDLADHEISKMSKATNVTAINDTGIADGEIAIFNLTNKDIRTSDKTIATTLGSDDTTVPTSKAVKDVTSIKTTGPAGATDGHLAVFDGATGYILKDGGVPGGGGSWTETSGTFTATPASTSTITMSSDLTATILVGYPLKYTIGGTDYYGVCSAITSNLLTVAGAPLGGDITHLYYGDFTRVEQMLFAVNGYYEDATNTKLLLTDLNMAVLWQKSKAYAVRYSVWSKIKDTSSDGKATVLVNSADVNSSAGGLTIADSATWYSTVVNINTSNYDINFGEAIELSVTKGTTGDAHDLVAMITFVYP